MAAYEKRTRERLNDAIETLRNYCGSRGCEECVFGPEGCECALTKNHPYRWDDVTEGIDDDDV